MAKPKKSEKPMQAVASRAGTHVVKTLLDSETLKELRVAMAEDGKSIVAWVRELIVEGLAERKRKKH